MIPKYKMLKDIFLEELLDSKIARASMYSAYSACTCLKMNVMVKYRNKMKKSCSAYAFHKRIIQKLVDNRYAQKCCSAYAFSQKARLNQIPNQHANISKTWNQARLSPLPVFIGSEWLRLLLLACLVHLFSNLISWVMSNLWFVHHLNFSWDNRFIHRVVTNCILGPPDSTSGRFSSSPWPVLMLQVWIQTIEGRKFPEIGCICGSKCYCHEYSYSSSMFMHVTCIS